VADPGEGVAADGTIRTGANRDRVPSAFEPETGINRGRSGSVVDRRRLSSLSGHADLPA
jgi:hypothetical protein